MKFNRKRLHRRSIRLKDYDYASAGAYFVTICAWDRKCLFGDVVNQNMQLNENGIIVRDEWMRSSIIRCEIELDEFIIMPNHMHGIMVINPPVGARRCLAPERHKHPNNNINGYSKDAVHIANPGATHRVAPTRLKSRSIGAILGQFKSLVTKQINISRNTPGMPVWQRNYFERVIRNEKELNIIRQYIQNNPAQWDIDNENPMII